MKVSCREASAAVCGSDWPASPFPKVNPGTVNEAAEVQMIAYKPGAGQLPAHWTTPHRLAQQRGTYVLQTITKLFQE